MLDKIRELARSYAPEWHFSDENPDIGSAIAVIFARQMEENLEKYNQVLEMYHTEFVNMLDISLKPARPAQGLVMFELMKDTVPGARIARGMKLLADTDAAGDSIVFETDVSIYVTNAKLDAVLMTEGQNGGMIPLLGEFEKPQIIPVQEEQKRMINMRPFTLFGEKEENMVHMLLFYDSCLFDTGNDALYVRITGNERLVQEIVSKKFAFSYYDGEELVNFSSTILMEDNVTFSLYREEAKTDAKLMLKGKEYGLIALRALEPVKEVHYVQDIAFSSEGEEAFADFAGNGNGDFDVSSFLLFGDVLSLFQECYIGAKQYFSKAKSLITLSFDIRFFERFLTLTVEKEKEALKIIKRKQRVSHWEEPQAAYAEEISLEYFNGIGWKKLTCIGEHQSMFAEGKEGHYVLQFINPTDWQETEIGAYKGRCIRIRLLKSDNCYIRPCRQYCPKICNLRISYSYQQQFAVPERVIAVTGAKKQDKTKKQMERIGYDAFSPAESKEDALYLGFKKPIEEGPVSLFFRLQNGISYDGIKCLFEYASSGGFKQMKVLDHTDGFAHTGIVMFLPPPDMVPMTLSGNRLYWMRIRPVGHLNENSKKNCLPRITDIKLNVVPVSNIETGTEEDIYLDEVRPNLHIPLGVTDILDVILWVNEWGQISKEEQKILMDKHPELVRTEYDMLGNLSAFFVRWEETERLDGEKNKRCYLLDRMNGELIFGDGVHTKLPKVLNDTAMKIIIRRSNGKNGNVPAGCIHDVKENVLFLDRITNPVPISGGSDMESLSNALKRGANIICSKKRLVSLQDYIREIKLLSDQITDVRMVTEKTKDGSIRPGTVTAVLLCKNQDSDSGSFQNLAKEMKHKLLAACELTIAEECLIITEPVFVRISVDVWVGSVNMDDSFEIQNTILGCLAQYLDPVESEGGRGWEIGTLPKPTQILMKLNVLKGKAIIQKTAMTALYTDETGTHEKDLKDVTAAPFMVCKSGEHRVHFMMAEE